jgi:hypothetical protein
MTARATVIAVLAALALAAALFAAHVLSEPKLGATTVEEGRANLERLIEARGPERAYAAVKEKYAAADLNLGHAAAHLFGEVLYEQEGVAGIASCDAELNFGCYHGLVASAVRAEGLEVVAELDGACAAALGPRTAPCAHGIGHGIVEYIGYGEEDLLPALVACGMTDQPDPLQGCTSGVFMAYNIPIPVSGDGDLAPPRAYVEADGPYAPCPSLPDDAWRAACYQQLPLWWLRALGYDFSRIGSLCAERAEEDARACISGVAKLAASEAGYSLPATEASCARKPGEWYDSCITVASLAFVSLGLREDGATLCAHASPDARSACPRQP